MSPAPLSPRPEPVVVHTSLWGLVGAAVSPAALLALGSVAAAASGPAPVPLLIVTLGVGLAVVTLVDMPRHTVFDDDGVTRVCWLRRHHLPWSRLVAIERTRPSTAATVRNLADRGEERRISGGLVARGPGRRRWLLTDRVESNLEYDRLDALMRSLPVAAGLRAERPHDGVCPTFLYRPRQHRCSPGQPSDGTG